jgi:hypothetical protein
MFEECREGLNLQLNLKLFAGLKIPLAKTKRVGMQPDFGKEVRKDLSLTAHVVM